MLTAVCKCCGVEKPQVEFPRWKSARSLARQMRCGACVLDRQRAWRIANIDRAREATRRSREKTQAGKKRWLAMTAEERAQRAAYKRQKRAEAGARPLEQVRLQATRNKLLALLRKRAKQLAPKALPKWAGLSNADAWRVRYRTDPEFNLKQRLRRQMRKAAAAQGERVAELMRTALKRNGASPSVEGAVGYTISELRSHLERQFAKRMCWQNYGAWHIDHIIPKSKFDLSDPQQVMACWALPNLRPVWAKANIKKGDKTVFLL